jgi:pimeloyl-ACP methyl ester carboxylesterase
VDHGPVEDVLADGAQQGSRRPIAGALRAIELGAASSPRALLLHGLPGAAEDFEVLAPLLAGELHTVSVDRRGYGASPVPDWSVDAQVAEFAEILRSWGAPALVLGHSYGGLLAGALAARHPDLVGALVLTAPALCETGRDRAVPPGIDEFLGAATRTRLFGVAQRIAFSRPARALGARLATPSAFAPDPVDAVHLARVRDQTLQPQSMRAALHEGRALMADGRHVDAELYAITAPTIVIHGRGDRVVKPDAGRRTAESIPGAVYHEIDGGHMITVTRAEQVAGLIFELARSASLRAPHGEQPG